MTLPETHSIASVVGRMYVACRSLALSIKYSKIVNT